ncbi:MAG: ABC transporter substrate-binding protein [Candidatus Methylacidiphilales bacterium]
MKQKSFISNFNGNHAAIALLIFGYLISVYQIFFRTGSLQSAVDDNVVRVTHWQLEPGFREALDWAIEAYNDRPEAKERGVRVIQAPITERVYNQFMNVHLISGTAPDLAQKGQSKLIQGNSTAKFFTPLSDYVSEPNPYNLIPLPDGSTPLASLSWKDSFIDGLQGGFDEQLDNYYAIPISVYGSQRIFYNLDLLTKVKVFAREQLLLHTQPVPEWIEFTRLKRSTDPQTATTGYLPIDQRLERWLEDPEATPETLGQMLFLFEACTAYAQHNNRPNLIPVSASSYAPADISRYYGPVFFYHIGSKINTVPATPIIEIESLQSLADGVWDFQSPAIREYFHFISLISRYYPVGFLGKDREQAQRQFVLGEALVLSSGGWDASGIYSSIQSRDRPEDRFEVVIRPAPPAATGERWDEFLGLLMTEANFKAGVPLAINMKSPHFDVALDFLQFVTSLHINQEFNRRSGWLPVVHGGEALDYMKPFSPRTEGIPSSESMSLENTRSSIRNAYSSNFKLYQNGEIGFEEFTRRFLETVENPRQGLIGSWLSELQKDNDKGRANDRLLSVTRYRQIFSAGNRDDAAHLSKFYSSLFSDHGAEVRLIWYQMKGEQSFPSLDNSNTAP